jgi:hypothetical protein
MTGFFSFARKNYIPQVVHRLPGRLRLRLPVLRQAGAAGPSFEKILEQLAALPAGIESVQSRFLTGSILVQYQPGEINESTVIAWMEGLGEIFRKYQDKLLRLHPAHYPVVAGRIEKILKDQALQPENLKRGITLPDDVWS